MEEILEIMEKNNKITPEEIAVMIGKDVAEIKRSIKKFEDDKVILGYNTLINWEKTSKDSVIALIEVKITPQRGEGFDRIAKRISGYKEVKACYLLSGGYDLHVCLEGKNLKEVSLFVSQKLATIENVLNTVTHFVLRKYKDEGIIFEENSKDTREAVVL